MTSLNRLGECHCEEKFDIDHAHMIPWMQRLLKKIQFGILCACPCHDSHPAVKEVAKQALEQFDKTMKDLAAHDSGHTHSEGCSGVHIGASCLIIGKVRKAITSLTSSMLDNPDSAGIYPTTRFYDQMETFIAKEIVAAEKRGRDATCDEIESITRHIIKDIDQQGRLNLAAAVEAARNPNQ